MCERTAVCRIERGPEVNSCSSRTEISYSLCSFQYEFINGRAAAARGAKKRRGGVKWNWCWVDVRELHTGLVQQVSVGLLASTPSDVISRGMSHILDLCCVGHRV